MKMKSSSSSLSLASKTQSFGCISLILHRVLCSGISSTYPSDQITEPNFKSPDFSSEAYRARGGEPGAVARLMGLDSIPILDQTRVVSRSRSVNSVDYLKRDNDEIQGKHRRVTSTRDSYQFPEYVELEDDKFFILSFEKKTIDEGFGELKHLGTRKCKKRRGTRESQSETENQTRVEDKENNINAMNVPLGRERLQIGELKQRRKEKRKNRRKRRETNLRKNIENENWIKSTRDGDLTNEEEEESENCNDSSPVSVLDYDQFAGVRVTPSPGNSSRRRLSSELESSTRNETILEDHITLTSRSREAQVRLHGYQEMWLMICRLTVADLGGSNWVYGKASKLEDLEGNIGEDIVSNILDQLLEETITTLSLTSQV